MPGASTYYRSIAAGVLALLCAVSGAQASSDLQPFIGRWRIDLSRTTMNRLGPNGRNLVRSSTFSFVFSTAEKGLQMDVFAQYPGPSSRTTQIIPDRKIRPCNNTAGCQTVGGDPADQSFAYFEMDGHMLARIFYIRGTAAEYTTYAVSTDGNTFTMVTWSAETPEWQNIQVFERQP